MSIQAVGWVLEHSPTKGAERLVLISIANRADAEDGVAWPSTKRIAREANVSAGTVKRVLQKLVEGGHLERLVNAAPDERIPKDKRPNLYRLLGYGGITLNGRGGQDEPPAGVSKQPPKPSEITITEPTTSEAPPPSVPEKPKKTQRKREPNLVWDALVEEIGWEPKTGGESKRIGRTIREIREACPDDATDEQIAQAVHGRARRYRAEWPRAELTPESLVKHWSRFGPKPGERAEQTRSERQADPAMTTEAWAASAITDEERAAGKRRAIWHALTRREAEETGRKWEATEPPEGWQPPEQPQTAPEGPESADRPEDGGSAA